MRAAEGETRCDAASPFVCAAASVGLAQRGVSQDTHLACSCAPVPLCCRRKCLLRACVALAPASCLYSLAFSLHLCFTTLACPLPCAPPLPPALAPFSRPPPKSSDICIPRPRPAARDCRVVEKGNHERRACAMAELAALRRLDVKSNAIRDVRPLAFCPCLETVHRAAPLRHACAARAHTHTHT